jgi:hypothetical protein
MNADKKSPKIFEIYIHSPPPLTGEGKGGGELNEISIPLPSIPSREGRGKY